MKVLKPRERVNTDNEIKFLDRDGTIQLTRVQLSDGYNTDEDSDDSMSVK